MPLGVIAATACVIELLRALSRYRILQVAAGAFITVLLTQRFLKIVPKALHAIMNS